MPTISDIRGGKRGQREPDPHRERDNEPVPTEAEEKLRMEAEAKAHTEAVQQLAFPIGGIAPSKFRVQLTGGAIELPNSKAALFQKDAEVEITIKGDGGKVELVGWVKTDKATTEQKGGVAVRESVVVVEAPE